MQNHRTAGSKMFDTANVVFLSLVALVTILPFIYIVAVSFASPAQIHAGGLILFPTHPTLNAYRYIFATDRLVRSMFVSVYVTVVGTLVNLVFTSLMAYPLARKTLRGRSAILLMVLFTMLFNGGMIPTYFVVKGVGLIDSLWSLMIPSAIDAFYLIILKNFFQNLPSEVLESAKVDGCHELGILYRIVIPLSLPAIATFVLFYAVQHWNEYFSGVLYLTDYQKWPIQVLLRSILIQNADTTGYGNAESNPDEFVPMTIKMAVVVFATLPIMCVYPFLQKHFTKGVLLGSVKG